MLDARDPVAPVSSVNALISARFDALRSFAARDPDGYAALRAANAMRTLRHCDDDALELEWRALSAQEKRLCWPCLDRSTRIRIRGLMIG